MVQGVRALALFSGGLDSILAARVVAAQGVDVIGVKFVSPFFDYPLLFEQESYCRKMQEKYGVTVVVRDISAQYLKLLREPRYGFGKNFNPCVDCKILMMGTARALLDEVGASFLISGEVLGQRPMSQRRDTLNVIGRDSETKELLLRPLSAKLLNPTMPEKEGLVDREELYDFNGRGRNRQLELAKSLGITDFPSPAGGCKLTDCNLAKRIAALYAGEFCIAPDTIRPSDLCLMLLGRQFLLPGKNWLIVGRDSRDNGQLLQLHEEGDILLDVVNFPGPTALLRSADGTLPEPAVVDLAASVTVRYAKKVNGVCLPHDVERHLPDGVVSAESVPVSDAEVNSFLLWK